jgi:hypothetical protein
MSDEWTDFQKSTYHEDQLKSLRKNLKEQGMPEDEIDWQIDRLKNQTIYLNNHYQVAVDEVEPKEGTNFPPIIHLSIKRRDKRQLSQRSHWRDLQRIKNELVGEEHEAVEMYPADSRKVDTSNQYHPWVIDNEEFQFPWGFHDRMVIEGGESKIGARQADPDDEDAQSAEEAMQNLTDQA